MTATMPIDDDKKDLILAQLVQISRGEAVRPLDIGRLTSGQHSQVNNYRAQFGLPGLISPEIIYIGKHHYKSRSVDGYTIEDMYQQLKNGLCESAIIAASHSMTALQNHAWRIDGYGNSVRDKVILELTSHKPRVEAFSVIPKGDKILPKHKK